MPIYDKYNFFIRRSLYFECTSNLYKISLGEYFYNILAGFEQKLDDLYRVDFDIEDEARKNKIGIRTKATSYTIQWDIEIILNCNPFSLT